MFHVIFVNAVRRAKSDRLLGYLNERAWEEGVSDLLERISTAISTIAPAENHKVSETGRYPNGCHETHDSAQGILPGNVMAIRYEDFQLTFGQRLKLPARRELSSRPWSVDQIRVFMEIQKNVPDILAQMGIEIADSLEYTELQKEWSR